MRKEENLFQINRFDMTTDYEMIDNVKIEEEYFHKDDYLDPNILVFEMINGFECAEVATNLLFIKVDENHFYNEATGLVFDINKSFNKGVNPFFDEIGLLAYIEYVNEFLDIYIKLKEKDNDIKSKGMYLLLKKNKIFTKETC